MSILSEPKPIQHWLDTPIGYYVGEPLYGNKIERKTFSNMDYARYELGSIVDDIRFDLGDEIADSILSIDLAKASDDTMYIIILSKDGQYSIGEVK